MLGGLLLRPELLDWVIGLTPEDFYSPSNARIYATVQRLRKDAQPVDTVIVREELAARGELAMVGGDEYLLALTDTIPVPSHLVSHAAIVRERASRRRILALCGDVAHKAEAGEGAAELLALLERAAHELRAQDAFSGIRPIATELACMERKPPPQRRPERRSTRVEALDRVIGGWSPGELVLLGGEAHAARRTLALRVAHEAARTETVALATTASIRDVLDRLLALEGADPSAVQNARLFHLHIRELDATTCSALALVQAKHNLDLVVAGDLDCAPRPSVSVQLRRTRALKRLAEDLRLPVFATWAFHSTDERALLPQVAHLLICRPNGDLEAVGTTPTLGPAATALVTGHHRCALRHAKTEHGAKRSPSAPTGKGRLATTLAAPETDHECG